MKAVLISIQPKWCELIASGKKVVEVRKTAPKLNEPFKCYIYCTKGDSLNYLNNFTNPKYKYWIDNKAFGNGVSRANGKVIGEFVCDRFIESFLNNNDGWFVELGCLTPKEIDEYQGDKAILYGWHISDLVIYDKPRELSEFEFPRDNIYQSYRNRNKYFKGITRPPQSWCYVESEGKK